MSEFWDDMLIKAAADEYLKDEYEKTQKEMENVEDIFHEKAAENDKKFKKLLKKEYKKQKRKEVRYPMFYRVATFVAVLLLVFDVCIFTVPAIRKAAVDFINRVTGEYTDIMNDRYDEEYFDKKSVSEKDFEYNKEYRITYVPQGMKLNDYSITPIMILYNYMGKDDCYLSFMQQKDKSSYNVDTENAKQSTTYINGNEAMVVEKDDKIILIYDMDEYRFQLESRELGKEELYKVAKSIKEVK